MLWTNVLLQKTTALYYALKADEYFAEKIWTQRIEIERVEKPRIDKFCSNLPEFNSQGQLIWAGLLTYEWLRFDQLPLVALMLVSGCVFILTTLATGFTNLASNWNTILGHCTHYINRPGHYLDINTYLLGLDENSTQTWAARNKKTTLFLWPFEINSPLSAKKQYIPSEGILRLISATHSLALALLIFKSHNMVMMVYWMVRTVMSVWLLDTLISFAIKMTRKLAPLNKKLRLR